MDSFEINKIVAAILVVVLMVIGIDKLSDVIFYVDKPETPGYVVEVKQISTASSTTENKIDIIFGTHAVFQKKVIYKNLGLIIIDEQHKFGVNQRKKLSDKGGNNCDVLLMTATPIPRTLTMTMYGDMDLSIISEKPKLRKPIKTYSKLESKIDDIIKFIKD